MKKVFPVVFFFYSLAGFSQAPVFPTSAEIYLGLKKLNVAASVQYIAAHPDDENTRLLTYFAKDKLYRTGYLSLTRGDGGQNLIDDEQGIELGLVRTQELLAARRIDGAEQFFSRAFDFGFSKTPEETFTKWDREKILSDVVWVIRKFQPDVIITRFPTTGEGGHGHHTASAILANEAFTAAADPQRFPEQLKWVQPWQAKRILWNTFNFSSVTTTASDQFKIDVGGYNPVLGKSYGEIAAESRSQHKSQGFGSPRNRGEAIEFFKTTGGTTPVNDLLDGIETGWKRIKDAEPLEAVVNGMIGSFDFSAPQKSVPGLVQLYKALQGKPDSYWKTQKLKEVLKLIEAASGLWAEAFTTAPYAVQGDSVRINFVLNDRTGTGIEVREIKIDDVVDTTLSSPLPKNKNVVFTKTIFVSSLKELTQPYWLKEKMKEGYFEVANQQLIGQADITQAYTVNYKLIIAGETFPFSKPVQYKFADQVKGEIYQPVFVIPSATVMVNPSILLFQKAQPVSGTVTLQFNANKPLKGGAEAHIKSLIFDSTKKDPAFLLATNQSKEYGFPLSPAQKNNFTTDNLYGSVQYSDNQKEAVAYLSMRAINYDHIPPIRYFYGDAVKILNLDIKTAGKKIGYIVGAGDKVSEALESMGYTVTLLYEKDFERLSLKDFDAIVSGVRAFNTDTWLTKYYDKLMKYVEGGGNYIVQYSQSGNLIKSKIGPYDFSIVNRRITDENAAVTFLKPEHPVLNYPNKITAADFKGWIQERSTYHADNLDSHYETILRMNDPGEAPHDGSLVIAKYGKGFFAYTGLVFFRELPAGVPGAYRLLANLIALNQLKPS